MCCSNECKLCLPAGWVKFCTPPALFCCKRVGMSLDSVLCVWIAWGYFDRDRDWSQYCQSHGVRDPGGTSTDLVCFPATQIECLCCQRRLQLMTKRDKTYFRREILTWIQSCSGALGRGVPGLRKQCLHCSVSVSAGLYMCGVPARFFHLFQLFFLTFF